MMFVRKPGRPLSCQCSSTVTAAIPRRQTCRCQHKTAAAMLALPAVSTTTHETDAVLLATTAENTAERTEPSATPPPLPVGRSAAVQPYRVQKSSSRTPSRKQSIDTSNLGTVDLQQHVSLVQPPLGLGPSSSLVQLPGGSTIHAPTATRPGFPNVLIYTGHPGSTTNVSDDRPGNAKGLSNGSGPAFGSDTTSAPASVPEGDVSAASCCSSKNGAQGSRAASIPMPAPDLDKKSAGCCSSKAQPQSRPEVERDGMIMDHHRHHHHRHSSLATLRSLSPAAAGVDWPSQQPVPEQQGALTSQHLALSTAAAYPVLYSSFVQQPKEDWQPFVDGSDHTIPRTTPAPPAPTSTGHFPNQTDGSAVFNINPIMLNSAVDPSWDTHAAVNYDCRCGPGCQCVGCAAHPYNQATMEYVYSGWISQWDEHNYFGEVGDTSPSNELHPPLTLSTTESAVPAYQHHHDNHHPQLHNQNHNHHHHHPHPTSADAVSPASDEAGGNMDEQTYPIQDFIFVNYSFPGGGACGGLEASCPCGDDCQCLGCAIHGNNGGLDFGPATTTPPATTTTTALHDAACKDELDGLSSEQSPSRNADAGSTDGKSGGGCCGGGGDGSL